MWKYYKRVGASFCRDLGASTKEHVIGILLAVGILVSQYKYGLIRPGEIRANLLSIAWPYALLVCVIVLRHLLRAPYELDRKWQIEREDTERKLAEKDAAIEQLTWPSDRPKLSCKSWGRRPDDFDPPTLDQRGFILANDGGTALEITIEPFLIGSDFSAFGSTVARIESGTEGFAPVCLAGEPRLTRWGLDTALNLTLRARIHKQEQPYDQPLVILISIIYRDFNDLWYCTKQGLIFTEESGSLNGVIEFTAPVQERVGSR